MSGAPEIAENTITENTIGIRHWISENYPGSIDISENEIEDNTSNGISVSAETAWTVIESASIANNAIELTIDMLVLLGDPKMRWQADHSTSDESVAAAPRGLARTDEMYLVDEAGHRRLCSDCNKPTLLTYNWVDEFMDPTDDVKTKELYPEQHDVDALPERVRRRYAEMLAIRHEPDAFAMRAGKTLEAVCADQGFPTDRQTSLDYQLKALVEHGEYPQPLAEQALIVKEYRNIASHDDAKLNVGEADVPLIGGFVDGMLDFSLSGPARLKELVDRLERRQEAGG